MAKIIKVNGDMITVEPQNCSDFQLKELQGIVGGYIEVVPIGDGQLIVVDEDGRAKGYQHNSIASLAVAGKVIGDIVGDMLICKDTEILQENRDGKEKASISTHD